MTKSEGKSRAGSKSRATGREQTMKIKIAYRKHEEKLARIIVELIRGECKKRHQNGDVKRKISEKHSEEHPPFLHTYLSIGNISNLKK